MFGCLLIRLFVLFSCCFFIHSFREALESDYMNKMYYYNKKSWHEILRDIPGALLDTARALLRRPLTSECRFIIVVQRDKLQISLRNLVNQSVTPFLFKQQPVWLHCSEAASWWGRAALATGGMHQCYCCLYEL